MSVTLPIYVFGNGGVCWEIFNAIAATVGNQGYRLLMSAVVMLAGSIAIIQYIKTRNLMVKVRWVLQYLLLYSVFFLPTCTVVIDDQINPKDIKSVDHVPIGIGIIANITTSFGAGLTELFEKNFTLPDDLRYSRSGMVMASNLFTAAHSFQITDATFAEAVKEYVQQCVFYDLYLKKYTMNDLLQTPDIWGFLMSHASPARAFKYNDTIETCLAGGQKMTQRWASVLNQAQTHYGKWLVGDKLAGQKSTFLSYLQSSYKTLTNASTSGSDLLKQALMGNAIRHSISSLGAKLDAQAVMSNYAFEKAQQQKRVNNDTIGKMAMHWLPLLKNVLECILYGAFVFVFLLSLLPNGLEILKNYFMGLLWLQLWSPLYAIINLIVTFYAKIQTTNAIHAAGASADNLTLASMSGITQVNSDMSGVAGYLAMSVPLLSFYLFKFGTYSLTQVAQYMGGMVQSAASGGAVEASSGNISLGNTSVDNESAFNMNAYHANTNAHSMSGLFSYQLPSGAMLGMTSTGSTILDTRPAVSNLATNINFADAISQNLNESADHFTSLAQSDAESLMQSYGETFQNVYDLASTQSHSEVSGEGAAVSTTSRLTDALNTSKNIVDRVAANHNVDAHELMREASNFYVNGGGGLDGKAPFVNAHLGMGVRRDGSTEHSIRNAHMASAAQELSQNKQFTESMDTVLQGVKDHSFRSQNEEGDRLVNNLNTHFNQGVQAQHNMSTHLQQGESYRSMASFAQSEAAQVNTNASQAFHQWVQDQGVSPSQEARMQIKNPMLARQYANQFVDQQAKHLVQGMQHLSTTGASQVQGHHQSQFGQHKAQVNQSLHDHRSAVQGSANARGLGEGSKIDHRVKTEADDLFVTRESKITHNKENIDRKGGSLDRGVRRDLHRFKSEQQPKEKK